MYSKRLVACVATLAGLVGLVACGNNGSTEPITGSIVFSTCVENGTHREVRNLDVSTGTVEWKRYFNIDETAGVNSIAKCTTALTGAEQNAAFNDHYRAVLATQVVPNGETQSIGWISATKRPVVEPTSPKGIFSSGVNGGVFLPGAYDGTGQGMTYYGETDPANNRDIMMAHDGLSAKQIKETAPGDPQMVYLPVGSRKPQFTSGGIDGYTAFKGNFGFSSQHQDVRYGTPEEIFGGNAKTATTTDGTPAPRVIKVLGKDRYIGFTGEGIFDVRRKGSELEAAKLYDGKGNINTAIAGPDDSVAFVLNGPTKEDYYAHVDVYVLRTGGGDARKVASFKNWEGTFDLMAFRR